MAIFKINKTRDYTVMSNYHLRDTSLSCKACGLLSKMLSLPGDWDYTVRGLSKLCRDGVDAISSGLRELEKAGYLRRSLLRDDHGRMIDVEYTIYERPQKPTSAPVLERDEPDHPNPHPAPPCTDSPCTENPYTVNPCTENPAQLNTKELNTNQSSTKESSNNKSIRLSVPVAEPVEGEATDRRTEKEVDWVSRIRDQIGYAGLIRRYDSAQIDGLVDIILSVVLTRSDTIHIGNADYPADYVRRRFRGLRSSHMERVCAAWQENARNVRNKKAYLLTSMFNAVSMPDPPNSSVSLIGKAAIKRMIAEAESNQSKAPATGAERTES